MTGKGNRTGIDFYETEGADITLEAVRSPEAMARDGAEVTLSAEAMDALRASMTLWVASRMLRAIDGGHPPQVVTVRIVVKLDGRLAK